MPDLIIKKGAHASKPYHLRIRRSPQDFHFMVTFQDGMYHLLHQGKTDPDQYDWNKLLGMSFNLFTNHENSWMIGWRYNILNKTIELNRYWHSAGKMYHDREPFAAIDPKLGGLSGSMYLDYKNKRVFGQVQTWKRFDSSAKQESKHVDLQTHNIEFVLDDMRPWTREINTWFGGNEKAPRTIKLFKITSYDK